ncbi:hypothetical protein PENSUB_6786 [Penicillium subrubescens]|uniref:Uncharacterized protein n=1 Tax=Penicillium subrubescens TaxID=1316194 RepID=A0A1Q5TU75_9EURO|nr:hypothetical protein PENSUB_6786 [Penicillium subrubescens]
MAATQKLYPRGTVKRIVKAHSNRSVSKNADILTNLFVEGTFRRLKCGQPTDQERVRATSTHIDPVDLRLISLSNSLNSPNLPTHPPLSSGKPPRFWA